VSYTISLFITNYDKPPPDLINGEEEYEVEHILDSRRHGRGRKVQYLVKWKGYPDSENQWVNWNDMNTLELIAEFKSLNPNALTHIRRITDEQELPFLSTPLPSSLSSALKALLRRPPMSSNGEDNVHSSHGEEADFPPTRVVIVEEEDGRIVPEYFFPNIVNTSDEENQAPLPIRTRQPTPLPSSRQLRAANAEVDAREEVLAAIRRVRESSEANNSGRIANKDFRDTNTILRISRELYGQGSADDDSAVQELVASLNRIRPHVLANSVWPPCPDTPIIHHSALQTNFEAHPDLPYTTIPGNPTPVLAD
jgi:hypothetical protein